MREREGSTSNRATSESPKTFFSRAAVRSTPRVPVEGVKPILSRMICAVAALRDFSLDDLSARAGLSISRLSRLRSGAQVDAGDAKRVLRSLGVDPESLIKHIDTLDDEKRTNQLDDGLAAILLALQDDASETPRVTGTIRCDRLAILVPEGAAIRCAALVEKALKRGRPVRTASYSKAASYRGVFLAVGMPWRPRSTRGLRLEFNPANLCRRGRAFVRRIVGALRRKERVRISRVDIAVDVSVPMGWFQIIGSRTRKVTTVGTGQQLESLYLGAKNANLHFAIYDKRQERHDKANVAVGEPLTRIEARFKNRSWTAEQIRDIPDPFERLRILWLTGTDLEFQDRVLTRLARVAGWPLLQRELGSKHFQRLHDHYAKEALRCELLHPSIVFKSNWRREWRRVLASLGLPR